MSEYRDHNSYTMPIVVIIIFSIIGIICWKVFAPNTGSLKNGEYLFVHTHTKYPQLLQQLEDGGYVADLTSFKLLGWQCQMRTHVHPGRYHIKKGMSNYALIKMLRAGHQEPVRLVINKLRTKNDFIRLLSANLECDSAQVAFFMNDPGYLDQFGLDTGNVMASIMPDTYEFYWNINADHAYRKILDNYTRFWDKKHLAKLDKKDLNKMQAIIIASIVEEETNVAGDKPNIASVYINRLRKGMKLQADPTVKFAIGDFAIKRVTGDMLKTDSRYNTYLYDGLPPGPICTPSVATIEAVLEAPETNYLYFCAKADFSGQSAFAKTMDDQLKNARAYQKALNAKGIH